MSGPATDVQPNPCIANGLDEDMTPGETILYRSNDLALASFRSTPSDAWFPGSGPLRLHYIAFPKHAVEIRHEDRAPFVASPATISFLRPGDSYSRRAVSPEGDHAHYIALTPEAMQRVLEDAAPALLDDGPRARRLTGPGPIAADVYLEARLIAMDLAQGRMESRFECEERLALVLHRVFLDAGRFWNTQRSPRTDRRTGTQQAQHRRVERAKEYLARHFGNRVSLDDLARAALTTPCHLARLFKAHTGLPAHEYLTRVRLARSLDLILEQPGQLADIAVQLGFNHHSHFGERFRHVFGLSPSAFVQRATSSTVNAMRNGLVRQGIRL